MRKIVVFDGGWGGELVANYIQEELNIFEIIRVIDWRNLPYAEKTVAEVIDLTEQALRPHIGNCDLIVLGGYTVSLALSILREKYPRQKFIGMSLSRERLLRSRNPTRRIAVLGNSSVLNSPLLQNLKAQLPRIKFLLKACDTWERKIDANDLNREFLHADLAQNFAVVPQLLPEKQTPSLSMQDTLPLRLSIPFARTKPDERSLLRTLHNIDTASKAKRQAEAKRDETKSNTITNEKVDAVLLLNTHYLEYRADLEMIFGWATRIIDFWPQLLREICVILDLQGIDGNRSK